MSSPASRPLQPSLRDYEEFKPKFEWKDEQATHVLIIHLPGFVKDQLKLTYDEPMRSLNVRGEVPARTNGNRFLLLNKDFQIPDNAKQDGMRAKLKSDTLTITIPKTTPASPPLPPPAKPSPLPLPPLPPLRKPPIPTQRTELPKEEEERVNRPREIPVKLSSREIGRPINEKGAETERETSRGNDRGGEKDMKRREDKDSTGGGPGGRGADPAAKAVDLVVGLEEQRRLMVNVGVAALVLFALGAYICYYTLGLGRN